MVISTDTQELIIASFLKNSYLYTTCKDEITDGYFSIPTLKVIYKALQVYYKKYSSLPSLNELLVTTEECYYPQVGASIVEVKDTCCRLWNFPDPEESFIRDKITDFIRKVRSSQAFHTFIEQMKTNPSLDDEDMVSTLAKSLDVQLSSTKVYLMNDPEQMKEARQNAIGTLDQSKIIRSIFPSLNSSLMFGGWQPSTINMVVAPPGTGKSMYLINEGVSAASQGFEVLHIFIGDMVEYDGYIRYLSRISHTPQNELVLKTSDEQSAVVKLCDQQYNRIFDRIRILSYPSLALTVDTLIEDVNKFEKQTGIDFDMIIVDYPDNLKQDGTSLYTDGGILYSSLERMARLTKSVVLVASQPPKTYWNLPIIPLEAASESSKKQMCVDIMITMNTETRGADFGTIFLAKVRKGEVGKVVRFKTDFAKCLIEEISEANYNALKAAIATPKVNPSKGGN